MCVKMKNQVLKEIIARAGYPSQSVFARKVNISPC